MMIFLAITMLLAPIITIFFFIFYKIWQNHKEKIEVKDMPSVVIPQKIAKKDDDEITAVITTAINLYLNQFRR